MNRPPTVQAKPESQSAAQAGSGFGLLNSIYYLLKPLLPLRVRYSIRRIRAHYKLRISRDWPIMESAARPPEWWKGWPEGKKFAVVLTHDVEGQTGYDRCRELAALEARIGFRSSFNFVPEGEYRLERDMLEELTSAGFEVGVHDLRHDGSLYRSKRAFFDSARSINHYLREWGAVGFRAGFMFHNLEWLKALDVEYDASTFDTDPFEPQPEGVGTIFPFWVPDAARGRGYVELPYTLPQDSTMFLIFREKAVDVWKRKLDWLASHGGMVLLNVHPDYLAFQDRTLDISEFPAAYYEEFLTYIREKYAGQYWHALPREVSRYVRKTYVAPDGSGPVG